MNPKGTKSSVFDPIHQTESLDSKIVVALERLSAAFRAELWRENKRSSLSPIQIQILVFLLFHDEEKRTVSTLADEINVTRATVSAAVSTLERKKYIEKKSNHTDQRVIPLILTEEGKKIAREVAKFSDPIETQITMIRDDKKINLYETLLETIYRLQKTGVISMTRMCFSCRYFAAEGNNTFYCNLLQKELRSRDLRIDCPEHAPKN